MLMHRKEKEGISEPAFAPEGGSGRTGTAAIRSRRIIIGLILCLLCFTVGFGMGGRLEDIGASSVETRRRPAGPTLIAEKAVKAGWLNGGRSCLRCLSAGFSQGKSFEPDSEYASMKDYLEMLTARPSGDEETAAAKGEKTRRLCYTVGFVIGSGIERFRGGAPAETAGEPPAAPAEAEPTEQTSPAEEKPAELPAPAEKASIIVKELSPKENLRKGTAGRTEKTQALPAEEPPEGSTVEAAAAAAAETTPVPEENRPERQTADENREARTGAKAEAVFEAPARESAAIEWNSPAEPQTEESPADRSSAYVEMLPATPALPPTETAPEKEVSKEEPEASTRDQEPPPHDKLESIGFYTITAYCPCEICCGFYAYNRPDGKVYGASKNELTPWYSVASPLPFGTKIYIPGLGEFEVEDRTADDIAQANGNRIIDIYMSDHQEALEFGVRCVIVYRVMD